MGLGDWINRRRHNRGFGIQSPSAFFFITEVLNEKLPYYAYKTLERTIKKCGGMSCKHAKELFRITNYMRPSNCISVASEAASQAMSAARPSIPCHSIKGDNIDELTELFSKTSTIGMLYLGHTPHNIELLRTAYNYTNKNSVIIVEGISTDKATRELWEQAVKAPYTIVTYDMQSYGLLLFDTDKKKQNYKLSR
jgi:hypothetical protein